KASPGLYPETAAAVAPHTPAANLLNPSRELPLPGDPDHDQVFLLYPEQWPILPVLQSYYPGGEVSTVAALGNSHVATSYRVPAAVAMSAYGVALQLEAAGTPASPGEAVWSGRVESVG